MCIRALSYRAVILATLLGFLAPSLQADSPQFRGPTGNGVFGPGMKIPTTWGVDTQVKWKAKVPGRGWSSPVIWGDRVFITTAVEEKSKLEAPKAEASPDKAPDKVFSWEVHCLDRLTGKTLWKKLAHKGKPPIPTHRSNTYASETPVTDGERLYVYFGMVGVFCYDFDGGLVWKKALGSFSMRQGWGTASSLARHGEHLFALVDSEENSFLVSLRSVDGTEAWRFERPDEPSNWSSPVIWKNKERSELIVGGGTVRSHDPATGKVLWELDTNGGQTSASPCGDLERLIIGTEFRRAKKGREASGGMLCSVKPGASGRFTPKVGEENPNLHWFRERGGPEMSSPLLYGGYLYILERSDMLNCYHANNGEPTYRRTRVKGARPFWASPWAHDGLVYCLDEVGSTFVIKPGEAFDLQSVNKLDDQFWASTAVSEGTLIMRGVENIYCISP